MSRYAFGKEMARLGHSMSTRQVDDLLSGRLPTRRWDSILICMWKILGTTPYELLGLPWASSVYNCDPKKRCWPYPS
jgi:hypothetical protein